MREGRWMSKAFRLYPCCTSQLFFVRRERVCLSEFRSICSGDLSFSNLPTAASEMSQRGLELPSFARSAAFSPLILIQ